MNPNSEGKHIFAVFTLPSHNHLSITIFNTKLNDLSLIFHYNNIKWTFSERAWTLHALTISTTTGRVCSLSTGYLTFKVIRHCNSQQYPSSFLICEAQLSVFSRRWAFAVLLCSKYLLGWRGQTLICTYVWAVFQLNSMIHFWLLPR